MMKRLSDEFVKQFKRKAQQFFFCPGRINLIGEHIDYNGGKVLPCAISSGTYLAVGKNTDKKFRFHCLNFPEKAELHLQTSYSKTGKQWFNYPLGVINYLLKEDKTLSGVDMLFYGDLPVGAGLSSSASIEVVTAFALNEIFQLGISKKEIAAFCKKVENEFVGVNCGVMDQFAVTMGKKNKAILLNCDSLEYEYIPFKTEEFTLVIINTNKQRMLVGSKYNERFAECGDALKALRQKIKIQHLCELDMNEFEKNSSLIDDLVLQKRALHVISENERVHLATKALQARNFPEFGKLMYASHQSLKDNYEVTGIELDTIVDFCKRFNGCIGARMTGAGFGGCAIALVKREIVKDFSGKIISHYKQKIGYAPDVIETKPGNGVREEFL